MAPLLQCAHLCAAYSPALRCLCCCWQQVLELCPYALCFSDALAAACCLGQLVHYQGKLLQLQAAVLGANTLAAREAMACCPSLVKVGRSRATRLLPHMRCQQHVRVRLA